MNKQALPRIQFWRLMVSYGQYHFDLASRDHRLKQEARGRGGGQSGFLGRTTLISSEGNV